MGKKTNSKNVVWIYAIVLFTSAFIVLLVTAYSQIKFNKNIEEYKDEISNSEILKNKFKNNLSVVGQENLKLKEQVDKFKKENEKIKEEQKNNNSKELLFKESLEKIKMSNELLFKAIFEYNNKNIIECAKILKYDVNYELLEQNAQNQYDDLVKKSFKVGANQYYLQGRKAYNNKEYDNALSSLQNSLTLTKVEYFSDDCLYFIGMTYQKLEQKEKEIEVFKQLIQEYPDTSYLKVVNKIIKNANEGEKFE